MTTEPFIRHTGLAAPLDRLNVDTDQIIPKQFLKRIERTGFEDFLFYDWRYATDGRPNPTFELNAPRFAGAAARAGPSPAAVSAAAIALEPRPSIASRAITSRRDSRPLAPKATTPCSGARSMAYAFRRQSPMLRVSLSNGVMFSATSRFLLCVDTILLSISGSDTACVTTRSFILTQSASAFF